MDKAWDAWAAGFIDGEGSISLRKARNSITIVLEAAQTDPRPLYRLHSIYGGNLTGPYKPHGIAKKPIYRWRIYGAQAKQAVERMLPYLTVKQEHAIIISKFPISDEYRRLTSEERKLREQLRAERYT